MLHRVPYVKCSSVTSQYLHIEALTLLACDLSLTSETGFSVSKLPNQWGRSVAVSI